MNIIIIVFILSCVGIAYFLFTTFYKKTSTKFVENNEYKLKNNKYNNSLILFYTSWCIHCTKTIELWNTLKTKDKYNKYNIVFLEIDCDQNSADADMYNVTEYPTIILVKDDINYIYDANLSEETLDLFINTIITK
jgi:thiol-disulfide isomerase/thioredoxin